MHKISAVIITYNEEKNIDRCLNSLIGIADEIIILDSDSTDKTVQIAEKYNAKIFNQAFLGYAAQKNYANNLATYELILSLDADECLSNELKESILKVKNNLEFDAYKLNRLTNYAGNWIHHCGWYPDQKIRLFKKNKASWGGPLLHELLVIEKDSNLGFLKGDLLHYSFHSEQDHLKQIEKFTNISSKELFEKGKKASAYHIYLKPGIRFFTDYIIKLGVLDGKPGFIVCKNAAIASYLKYTKLKKHWNDYYSS